MKVTVEDWLLAQIGQEGVAGKIAKEWFESNNDKLSEKLSFQMWWNEKGCNKFSEEDHRRAIVQYNDAIRDLESGIPTETFPSMFANQEFNEALEKRADWHHDRPDITSAEYFWKLHMELWKEMKAKSILYLDTGYWVGMRQALTQNGNVEYSLLYERLVTLVEEGSLICPISFTLFEELVRQSDRKTRAATARLMDQLSRGVCIQGKKELIRTEIRRQIYRSIKPELKEAWSEWIFTKIGFMHGSELPYNNSFSKEVNNYIQKLYIDSNWDFSSVEEKAAIADNPGWKHMDNEQFADAHNQDFKHYREASESRKTIRQQEIGLSWQCHYKIEFEEIAREIFEQNPEACSEYIGGKERQVAPSPDVLPQIQIQSALSTFFASDHKKIMKATDLPDIEHATYALPYVGIFAGDRRLAHAIKVKPDKLDTAYHTIVVGSIAELNSLLDEKF